MSTKQRDPKWMKSRSTSYARRAIAEFVEDNADSLSNWLGQVAQGIPKVNANGEIIRDSQGAIIWVNRPDPGQAISALGNLLEFHLPKLSRAEVSAAIKQEGPLDVTEMSTADLKHLLLRELGIDSIPADFKMVESAPATSIQPPQAD